MALFPVWSLVHMVCFLIYISIIVVILGRGRDQLLNRTVSGLCACFALWSFGKIFLHNPDTPLSLAILMDRSNAIGWCFFPAVSVWFTLILTRKLHTFKITPFLIVTAALPLLFIYLEWSGLIFAAPVKRYYGWYSEWIGNSIWPYLYYLYYISAITATLAMIWTAFRRSTLPIVRKQFMILFVSSLASLLIGTYFEVIMTRLKLPGWNSPLSDIADTYISIWVIGTFYAIFRHNLFTITPATAADNIISNMSEALFLVSDDLKIIYANNAAHILLNYRQNGLAGTYFVSILKDRREINYMIKTSLQKNAVTGYETSLVRRNGGYVPVLFSLSALFEEGDVKGFACIAMDITERRIAEEKIKRERDRAQKYLDTANIIFRVLDNKNQVTLINKKGCEILGYSEEEILGQDWQAHFIPERIRDFSISSFDKLLKGEMAGDIEAPILTKNGKERIIRWSNSVLRDGSGEVTGLLSAGLDVTEYSLAQEEINKLSVAVEQSPSMVVITMPDGTIIYVNPRFCEITGYAKNEALGNNPRMLKSGETPKEQYKELWDTITSGSVWRGELHNKKKDGSLYWESASISPIKNQEGKITNFIAIKEDITVQKKNAQELLESYEKLKELDVLKTNFTSMVSHELRTPLTSIKGFLTFLLSGVAGRLSAQQKEYLEIINNNSERLLSLINDILDIAKMESGSFTIDSRSSNIVETLSSSVNDIQSIAGKKNIRIVLSTPGEKLFINMDPYRISQSLINLINNAIKFSSPGSRIYVTLDRPDLKKEPVPETAKAQVMGGNYVRICVKDEGIGIKKDNLNKIFSRFYQVENINTRHAQGTGLGLNICKNIIEAHGGAVWVESEGEGKGSSFCFLLPG